jgi:outer membrane protein TolC
MKRSLLLLLATAVACAAAVAAPAPATYTLDDCLRLGLSRSVAVANAVRERTIARAGVTKTRAQALPHLEATAGYTRLDEVASFDLGGTVMDFGAEDNFSAALGLKQLLYNGGQVNAGLRAARAYDEFAAYKVQEVREALARDIRVAFFGVLLAEAALTVQQESAAQLESLVAQAENRYRHQTLSEFELLSARVRLANEQPRLIQARNQLALAREQLRRLTQIAEPDFALDGALQGDRAEWPPVEDLIRDGLARRPELLQAERLIELREADARVTRSQYHPTLDAFANYTGGNSSATDPTQDGWAWHWNAGLSLRWNLTDGGLRRGTLIEKEQEVGKARANLEELRRLLAIEIRQHYLDLAHAAEAARVASENVALAQKGLDIARVRYEQGLSTYLEFTETNVALSSARLAMHQAQYACRAADARLRCAVAAPAPQPIPESAP